MKPCRNCNTIKTQRSDEQQVLHKKTCNKEWIRKWTLKYPDYKHNFYYKATYGITADDYNRMFAEQGGCCAICGTHQSKVKNRLSVDHNHLTNQGRGLLCTKCNIMIGNAKEDQSILQRAIQYLNKFAEKQEVDLKKNS